MANQIDDLHAAVATSKPKGLSVGLDEWSEMQKPKKNSGTAGLPMYYRDLVIFQDEYRRVSVVDCEKYHLGELDSPIYSSDSVEKCMAFIDGDRARIVSALRARGFAVKAEYLWLITPFLRLYLRIRRRRRLVSDKEPMDLSAILDSATAGARSIEYAGYLKPFMDTRVGTHPVFNFVAWPPPGFRFVKSEGRKLSWQVLLWRRLRLIVTRIRYTRRFMARGVPLDFIMTFWTTRGLTRDHLKVTNNTLTLYPTYLFFVPHHSWVVEIEDMLTLMVPFLNNGNNNPGLDRHHPYIKVLEVLIEGEECKGIISHLKATADGLRTIFKDNPVVRDKIRHIQLGMPLPARVPSIRKEKPTVNILFINGWAQDVRAAYRRGLLDALKAFSLISNEFDNVTMTVRSGLPKLDEEYKEILADKKIILIEEKLSLRQLRNLYEHFKNLDIGVMSVETRIVVTVV